MTDTDQTTTSSPSPRPLTHTPEVITVPLAGIAKAVAKALGKEADIVLYDPEKLGLGKGGKADGFPFRCACVERSL